MSAVQEWWRYERWQEELEKALLRARPDNTPASLFVDSGQLSRLFSNQQDRTLESLAKAVSSRCRLDSRSNLFEPVNNMMAKWRLGKQSDPPPCLPLLVLTVIAATEMRVEGGFRDSAYYPRLVEIFRLSGIDVSREYLSDSFDDVPPMWQALAKWLAADARRGVLALTPHPKFTRIGFSLAQALVRGSDRARLTTFFHSLGLQPGDEVDKGQLLVALRLWCTRDRGFTKRFLAALDSDDAVGLVLPVVTSLAATWDGVVVATGGKRFLSFSLAIDLDDWSAAWVIRKQPGLLTDTLELVDGSSVRISTSDEVYTLYEVEGALPEVRDTIGRRFDAEGADSFVIYKPKDVTVLTFDHHEATWIENTGIQAFEECILVVRRGRYAEVESILRRAADPGWALISTTQTSSLVPNHIIVRNVVFSDNMKFRAAITGSDRELGDEIRPDPAPIPRLANGLKIDLGVSAGVHYIAGGEPDLILPLGLAARQVAVSLDGNSQELTTSDFPVPLRATSNLKPGQHVLVADGRTLRFQILDHAPDVSRIVKTRYRNQPLVDWTDSLDTAPEIRRSKLLPMGGSAAVWAIEYTGLAYKIEKKRIPGWFDERGLGRPNYFEPDFNDRVAWIVRTNGQSVLDIYRVASRQPHFARLDSGSHRLWRMISKTEPTRFAFALLPAYIQAWRRQEYDF